MNDKLRVNRPETAAKVLTEFSKQARGIGRTSFLFMAAFAAVAAWPYGFSVVAMAVCLAGIMASGTYLIVLQVLVLNWHDIQFYRPTPKEKMRGVVVNSRGRTTILEVRDRVGG